MSVVSLWKPTEPAFSPRHGLPVQFVQDNHSGSRRGALRGLHYQIRQAQGKLVRVIAGEVFDVVVDLRRSSPTFGKWVGVSLSAQNRLQMWIPTGFCPWLLRDQRVGRDCLQNDRLLRPAMGANFAVERPGDRHCLASPER